MNSENLLLEQLQNPSDDRELVKKQEFEPCLEYSKNPRLQRLRELIKDQQVMKSLLQEEDVKKVYLCQTVGSSCVKKQCGLSRDQLKLIRNMKMSKSSQTCTICIENFEADQIIKKLPCNHILHRQCGKMWFKTNIRCPVCRFDLKNYFENIEKAPQEKKQTKGKF